MHSVALGIAEVVAQHRQQTGTGATALFRHTKLLALGLIEAKEAEADATTLLDKVKARALGCHKCLSLRSNKGGLPAAPNPCDCKSIFLRGIKPRKE
jgi:hypothetical protein